MVKHLRVTRPDQPSNQMNYKAYPKSSVIQSKNARASSMNSELDEFQNQEQLYDSSKSSLMSTQTTKVSFQSLNPISTCLKTLSNTEEVTWNKSMKSSSVSANPPALLDKIKTTNTMNELPSTRPSLLDRLSDSVPCQQTVKMMNMPEEPDSTTTCYRGTKRKAQAMIGHRPYPRHYRRPNLF